MQTQATTSSWKSFGTVETVRSRRSFQMAAAGETPKVSVRERILDLHSAMEDPFSQNREYFRGNDYY